jgi:hypothetical protein
VDDLIDVACSLFIMRKNIIVTGSDILSLPVTIIKPDLLPFSNTKEAEKAFKKTAC